MIIFVFKGIFHYIILPTIQKRKYGKNGTIYFQYRINVSQLLIETLSWKGSDKVELFIKKGELICKNLSKIDRAKLSIE